jgi:hypothetical protein
MKSQWFTRVSQFVQICNTIIIGSSVSVYITLDYSHYCHYCLPSHTFQTLLQERKSLLNGTCIRARDGSFTVFFSVYTLECIIHRSSRYYTLKVSAGPELWSQTEDRLSWGYFWFQCPSASPSHCYDYLFARQPKSRLGRFILEVSRWHTHQHTHTHTQTHTPFMIPLKELWDHSRGRYIHNTHTKRTSMPSEESNSPSQQPSAHRPTP